MDCHMGFMTFFIGMTHGDGGFAKTIATPSAFSWAANSASWSRKILATLSKSVHRTTYAAPKIRSNATETKAIRLALSLEDDAAGPAGSLAAIGQSIIARRYDIDGHCDPA